MGAVAHIQKKASTPEDDAELMAKMLTSSVDLAMSISAKMNVSTDTSKAEALRFELTALAAKALSNRARLKGKEPSGIDMDSLKATTDSLFMFAGNFTINETGIEYLKKIGFDDVTIKESVELHLIEALLPVISVIDHKDRGLFPNIADRLIKEADALSAQFIKTGNKSEEIDAFAKQKILKLLAQTFVTIYPNLIGGNKSIGDVWQEFDRQKALIVLLLDYLLTGERNIQVPEDDAGDAPTPASTPNVTAPPKEESAPVLNKPAPPPQPTEQKQAAAEEDKKSDDKGEGEAAVNPFSFFKKD